LAKRRPGGQPDNKNAEKHGYYAAAVSPAMRNALRRAQRLQDGDTLRNEIALARAHVYQLLQLDPTNHEILRGFLNTIARMLRDQYNLSRNEEHELGAALTEMLAELMPDREI
jgi:hypothetical protein